MKLHLVLLGAALVGVTVSAQRGQAVPAPPASQAPVTASNAPAPSRGTGLIMGKVVDGTSGAPIAGVAVTLNGASGTAGLPPGFIPGPPARAMTAADGHFLFFDLPKGTYAITATIPGHVAGAYGKRSPIVGSGQTLQLEEGERRTDANIQLWEDVAFAGTVTDEAGEPVVGIPVTFFRRFVVAGRWQFSPYAVQPTDDRGMYRMAEPPGDYVVGILTTPTTVPTAIADGYADSTVAGSTAAYLRSLEASSLSAVSPFGGLRVGAFTLQDNSLRPPTAGITYPARLLAGEGQVFVYPTTFYPGTATAAQATTLSLVPGEVRSSVNFQLRPVPTFQLSGTATTPSGPFAHGAVQLLPEGVELMASDSGNESARALSDGAGGFTFLGVVPGRYTIRAVQAPTASAVPVFDPATGAVIGMEQAGGPTSGGTTLSAVVPVTVTDHHVSGVALSLQPGARVSGRIEFNGAAEPPAAAVLTRLNVAIEAADGRRIGTTFFPSTGRLDAEGRFTSQALVPGKYLVRVNGGLPGWTFAGAFHQIRNVTDGPLDVSADVEGVVLRFTDRPSELAGTVREDRGAADTKAAVVLFPANAADRIDYGTTPRRFRSQHIDRDGTYRFPALPAGDYFVAAVPDTVIANWQAPTMLQTIIPLAVRVTIGEGEKRSQDLTTRQVR